MLFRSISDKMPEFDFRVVGDGRSAVARYANNSNYRNDSLIRKESKAPLPEVSPVYIVSDSFGKCACQL